MNQQTEITELLVKNLHYPITALPEEIYDNVRRKLGLSDSEFVSAGLHKRSLDARRRDGRTMEFVCSVTVKCRISEKKAAKLTVNPLVCERIVKEPLTVCKGTAKLHGRPLVVGFGPCGMFAALLLAENGYAPIVIERGGSIAERTAAVECFNRTGILNTETNIQFGAGGAGTFSDGKLVTRINDAYCSYVLERFRDFGAPEEICSLAKPHIGTDKLLTVVENIRRKIEMLGGEVRFHTKLTDFVMNRGEITAVKVQTDKIGTVTEFSVGAVLLAVGHSARDTYEMLDRRHLNLSAKPFSVGVRVEHLQSDIDYALYGKDMDRYVGRDGKRLLPPGEYSLSYREAETGIHSDTARGVYSFCMCPGGEVVAAASEENGVVTNGMSRYARDGRNANAAIAVSVFPEDIGGRWRDGIEFQRTLERRAYRVAGGDYHAPVETLGDFMDGKTTAFTKPTRVIPTYRDGFDGYCLSDLSAVLPDFVTAMLKKGFPVFAKRMHGFDARDTVLTGVETRTSAPVRILRGDDRLALTDMSDSIGNLYPCGEGAGYAGGITSAAVDGLRTALAMMEKYGMDFVTTE